MEKHTRYDLTSGSILNKLLALSLPIMGTNLVQMAYNLADIFWLGRLGSNAVAASGTVGIYMWLAMAFMLYGNKGAEIGVAQNIGGGKPAAARDFVHSSLWLSLGLGVGFAAVMLLFRVPLVGFFNIREAGVVQDAQTYLAIVSLGFPFAFVANAVMGCFSGSGNTMTPFILNTACLLLNIVLDPLFIFTFDMGIAGAAWATMLAQTVNCFLMVAALKRYRHPVFEGMRLWSRPVAGCLKQIAAWATPIAVESFFFTFLAMLISRFIAAFGAAAIAVQRIGSQVESLSWLVAGGFASAFTAYIGQNYGAGQWPRIHKGFRLSLAFMGSWGLLVTVALFLGSGVIFTAFLPNEPAVVAEGARYLRILAVCQWTQCLEPVAAGAYRGMGRTLPPSLISTIINALRVPLCWVLGQSALGLVGIWWGITIGASVRALVILGFYLADARKLPRGVEAPTDIVSSSN